MNFKPGDLVVVVRDMCCPTEYIGHVFQIQTMSLAKTIRCRRCHKSWGPGNLATDERGCTFDEKRLKKLDAPLDDESINTKEELHA